MLPSLPAALPLGFAPHPADRTEAQPHPEPRPQGRAVAGAFMTVTSRSGTDVTIHRADYDVLSARGGWTVHGYAWRCPACPRLALGYRAEQFGEALGDAYEHECECEVARRG